jgi:hypothetical protein
MSTDIQHLGRQDSDSTVVGGESLIQLRHLTADTGQFFNQMNLDTHVGQIQGSLDTGDASSNNKDVFIHDIFPFFFTAN